MLASESVSGTALCWRQMLSVTLLHVIQKCEWVWPDDLPFHTLCCEYAAQWSHQHEVIGPLPVSDSKNQSVLIHSMGHKDLIFWQPAPLPYTVTR